MSPPVSWLGDQGPGAHTASSLGSLAENAAPRVLTRRLRSWLAVVLACALILPAMGTTMEARAAVALRTNSGLAVLYDFRAGSGMSVPDSSPAAGPAMVMQDAQAVTWTQDGLRVDAPTRIASDGPASGLRQALNRSDAVTVEAWVTPGNLTQGGPARIVSLASSREENVVVGQGNHTGGTTSIEGRTQAPGRYMSRLQTSGSLTTSRTHVVYVKASDGSTSIYLDGRKAASDQDGQRLTNLHPSFGLTLTNQPDGSRPWLGTLHLVAVYGKALSAAEVAQNFAAGLENPTPELAPEPTPEPEPDPKPTPEPEPEDAVTLRVGRGLEAFYDFSRGSGNRLPDSSVQPGGLDLVVADPDSTRWDEGGLTLLRPTVVASEAPVTRIRDALAVTNQLTVEAWVTTASLDQGGPARIVGMGAPKSDESFFVGQGNHVGGTRSIEGRVDSAAGYMSRVETADRSLTTRQTQVVYVYAANGDVKIYLDGKKAAEDTTNHRVNAWTSSTRLFLGNRLDGQRPWLGTVHSLAIYSQALTAEEVAQNFEGGPTGTAEVQPEPVLKPAPEPGPQPEPTPDPEPAPPLDPVVAPPGQAEGNARSLSRHGITWTFDREYPYGTYVNGDYWVQGPINVVKIDPPSRAGDGWNGSMIDVPIMSHDRIGNPKIGYGGYMGFVEHYDPSLNLGLASSTNPKAVAVNRTLVSTIGRADTAAIDGSHARVETAAVLTVVEERPADRSFRPSYVGRDKTSSLSFDQVDLGKLPSLPRVQDAPHPDVYAKQFEQVWLDHVAGWYGRRVHPHTAMRDYGRDLANEFNRASLALMLDYDEKEKQELVINLIQIGIDFNGIVEAGGHNHWRDGGGHSHGRKWPILFAGYMLDDSDMLSIGQRADVKFGEDFQTFFVSQLDGKPNGGHGGYEAEHLGMPEWRFGSDIESADLRWDLPYRHCCSATAWGGAVLSARLLGLQDAWNHEALFAYQDRYVETAGPHQFWDPFTESMWWTYRNFGYVAPQPLSGPF